MTLRDGDRTGVWINWQLYSVWCVASVSLLADAGDAMLCVAKVGTALGGAGLCMGMWPVPGCSGWENTRATMGVSQGQLLSPATSIAPAPGLHPHPPSCQHPYLVPQQRPHPTPWGLRGLSAHPVPLHPMGALSSLSVPLSPGTRRDLTCIQQHHELPTNPGTGTWGSVPVRSRPHCRGGGDVCRLIGQMVTAGGAPAPRSLRR